MKYLINLLFCFWAAALSGQTSGEFLYAAQDDGTVHVYDMNKNHVLVKTIRVFTGPADVRGAFASARTHRFYVAYNLNTSPIQGWVACFDLTTNHLIFNRMIHSGGVDRGSITPDGLKIYMPTYEGSATPYEMVLDQDGIVIDTITMPINTHDTLVSIDGSKVWMENKLNSDRRMRMATTADSDRAIQVISQQAPGKIAPFSVTSHGGFLAYCSYGYYGFRWMNGNTGVLQGSVPFSGTKPTSDLQMHGIGITPNETEVWACDRGVGNHYVHVFQMKRLPPTQTHLVTVSNDNPHWLTFDIDGKYCYVAGAKGANRNTDIVSTASYSKIGQISPSEDMLEVDFVRGAVSAAGNQFGVGRLP